MLRRVFVVCLVCGTLVLAVGAGWADTRNVSAGGSIQAAIDAATNGDSVVIAAGTYRESIDFKGKAITVRSTNPTSNTTVQQTVIDGMQANQVVYFHTNETATSVLSGLTIKNGKCGIYCYGYAWGSNAASPTIRYCTITANTGLGIDANDDKACPTVEQCTVTANTGRGVLFRSGAAGSILNCVISNNSGSGVQIDNGGTVEGNTITGNSTTSNGGGISCTGGCIVGNMIRGNSAQNGAGIYCRNGAAVYNNLIVENLTGGNGGGIYCDSSNNLWNNTICDNQARATSGGGNIYLNHGSPVIRNCIVAYGKAGFGIYVHGSAPIVSYCASYSNNEGNYGGNAITPGPGCIEADPLFVSRSTIALNYRLKSKWGHWVSGTTWAVDTVSSPCIDAGDPLSDYANEPPGNGGRINMGFDGNTQYASKSNQPPTTPTAVTIAPTTPGPEKLTATATSSTDADGDAITYKYQWSKKAGTTWTAWAYDGRTLPAGTAKIGEIWRVRARAYDGTDYSGWKGSSSVTIVTMAGLIPAPKTYNVPINSSVFVTFRWPVQQSSVTKSRVNLTVGGNTVLTTMTWVTPGRKIKLRPTSNLLRSTRYYINLNPGIVCVGGRVLGWSESSWFETVASSSPAAVTVAASPTAAGAQFSVNLNSVATVRTMISNIAGRVIAELPERDLPAGVSSLLWNGRSNSGTKVPAGAYLVRVEAKGEEGQRVSAVAPLHVR
ncbi:MAG: right-handed parallel beta-helix repeat-containing protein [Armatimonadia bacterium]